MFRCNTGAGKGGMMLSQLKASFWGCGLLLAGAVLFLDPFAAPTVDFRLPAADGSVLLIYRCDWRDTLTATQERARAAHAVFDPALRDAAREAASALAQAMQPGRASSETAALIEAANAEALARRTQLSRDLRQRFGCDYRGSA